MSLRRRWVVVLVVVLVALSSDEPRQGLSASGDLFDRALRKCLTCKQTTNVPTRVEMGNNKVTEYCRCGGELRRV